MQRHPAIVQSEGYLDSNGFPQAGYQASIFG